MTSSRTGSPRLWQPAPAEPDFSPIAAGHDRLAQVVAEARAGLEDLQKADGHWVFELEADATIPAEYVLLEHFLSEIDQALESRIAVYLRAGPPPCRPWERLSHFGGGDLPPIVIDQAFPIEEVDLGKRHRAASEYQDGAQAVGVIRPAIGRLPGLCGA